MPPEVSLQYVMVTCLSHRKGIVERGGWGVECRGWGLGWGGGGREAKCLLEGKVGAFNFHQELSDPVLYQFPFPSFCPLYFSNFSTRCFSPVPSLSVLTWYLFFP